jgi:hypothetical protein
MFVCDSQNQLTVHSCARAVVLGPPLEEAVFAVLGSRNETPGGLHLSATGFLSVARPSFPLNDYL